MDENTKINRRSIEGEPLWVTYAREYILPALVMCGMLYFLYFHVLAPMVELRQLTRSGNDGSNHMDEGEVDGQKIENRKLPESAENATSIRKWKKVN